MLSFHLDFLGGVSAVRVTLVALPFPLHACCDESYGSFLDEP